MKEVFLHWRNFWRLSGLILLISLLFRYLSHKFYLVPLVETSLDPHTLLAISYFGFLFIPWALAVVYLRHSENRYVKTLSRMLMVFPLIIGGFALNSYFQGYELLLWTPLVLILRRWTSAEAGEWLNELLLRNNLSVPSALRSEWVEKVLGGSLHSRSEIKLELLGFIKTEASRQKEVLTELPSFEGGLWSSIVHVATTEPWFFWSLTFLGTVIVVTGVWWLVLLSRSDGGTAPVDPQTLEGIQLSLARLQDSTTARITALESAVKQHKSSTTASVKLSLDANVENVKQLLANQRNLVDALDNKLQLVNKGRLDTQDATQEALDFLSKLEKRVATLEQDILTTDANLGLASVHLDLTSKKVDLATKNIALIKQDLLGREDLIQADNPLLNLHHRLVDVEKGVGGVAEDREVIADQLFENDANPDRPLNVLSLGDKLHDLDVDMGTATENIRNQGNILASQADQIASQGDDIRHLKTILQQLWSAARAQTGI
jgi:hypothetical protein